jgi:hypothetical protein
MTGRVDWSTRKRALTTPHRFPYAPSNCYKRRRAMFRLFTGRASSSIHLTSYYNSSMMM